MLKAGLYQKYNKVQRHDAKNLLKEFSHIFKGHGDSPISVIDIGCGSGDITFDYLLPELPNTFEHLIGVDISDDMINYGNENYKHPKITFEQLDFGKKIEENSSYTNAFTFATAFYCLHWIPNQKQAFKNIYNLLKPNGECLLMLAANNSHFDGYKAMSCIPKWAEYMKDVDNFIPLFKNPLDIEELVKTAGFTKCNILTRDKTFIYPTREDYKEYVEASNPFLSRVPQHLHEEYIELMTTLAMENYEKSFPHVTRSYSHIICHAEK